MEVLGFLILGWIGENEGQKGGVGNVMGFRFIYPEDLLGD